MAAGMQHIFRRLLIHNREHFAATKDSALLNAVNHKAALRTSSLNLLPALRRVLLICSAHTGVSVVRNFLVRRFQNRVPCQ